MLKVFILKCVSDNRGAAALLTVVIVGAAVLIMAFSASILGWGELEMSYSSQKGGEALALADGCLEEALWRLRLDSNYPGGVLDLEGNSCIINVASEAGQRTIKVSAAVDNYHKKVQAEVILEDSVITVTSWQEVSD